jgi:hypothetical protein
VPFPGASAPCASFDEINKALRIEGDSKISIELSNYLPEWRPAGHVETALAGSRRVLAAAAGGGSHQEAGERFGASVSRWRNRERQQGVARGLQVRPDRGTRKLSWSC